MDNKITKFLDNLLENEVLDTEIYQKIIKFDENNNLSQKSKVARAITLMKTRLIQSWYKNPKQGTKLLLKCWYIDTKI